MSSRFLAVLVTVAQQAQGGPMTEQQKDEWLQALDYFQNAAPRHTADEEESLFPRLRKIEHPQIQDALAQMEELEGDHERANKWHEEVDQLGRRWLTNNTLAQDDMERLTERLTRLATLYRRHIALEDESVLPLAAAVLPRTEQTHIGVEMAQRRGLDPRALKQAMR